MTPVQERHTCFRAVLTALAYPGRPVPSAATPELVLESIYETGQAGQLVFLVDGARPEVDLESLPRGDEERPEAGATVIVRVAAGAPQTAAWIQGPGLRERTRALLPLSRELLAARTRACADPPAGIDLVVVGADGSVLGLPRTTQVVPD